METEALDTSSSISSSTKTSSWPIVRGSIEDSVTFESSISALDSNSDQIEPRKPPLILRRPSPDSGPCEITIGLAHQHEIRQVYVRSTARVYEIYYAADEKCGNEYLCTVRCGLAAQNDEPAQVTDAVGSVPASYTDSNRCREEGHSRTESGSSINEDGWVDVVPSGSDGRDSSLSNRNQSCSEKSNQDLFEATAEISDTDPVMSLTLRMLSIQSGDYIYIDEVYVYADPFVSEESDSSSNMPQNSSGSALMSMLVPTLLQLSKSRRNDSPATERIKSLGADHKSTVAATSSSAYQSERMPSSEIHGASVHMSQPQVPMQTQVPPHGAHSVSGENRFSCSHIERTLDELVSRITRIEHFCLRFEENMLKPISSMEARLEKVEQQLDSLSKNPLSCSRISPPECHDLKSNSTSVTGNDCHGSKKPDLLNNDASCQEVILVAPSEESVSANAVQHSDMPDLIKNDDCCYEVVAVPTLEAPSFANGPQLHPSLVVTAPDFSSIDDDEENDVIEAVKESPKDTAKKPLSIDDALASALAGFLSLASTDPSECSRMAEETAKSPVERSVSNSSIAVMQDVEPAVPSVNINEGNEPISIYPEEVAVTEATERLAAENNGEEKTKVVGLYHFSEEEDRNEHDHSRIDGLRDVDEDNIKDNGSTTELGCPAADDAASEPLGSDFSKTPAVVGNILLNDDSVGALELEGDNMDASSSKEVVKENPTLLRNILELPIPATVDFGIPILDVKFSSLENSSAKSLEALLVGMPESQIEISCLREDSKSSSSEPTDLVVIEDGDSVACETANNQLFLGSYESSCLPSNTEERQQDPHDCSDQDMCASLI